MPLRPVNLPGTLLVAEVGGSVLRDGHPYAAGPPGRRLVAGASEPIAAEITRALASAESA